MLSRAHGSSKPRLVEYFAVVGVPNHLVPLEVHDLNVEDGSDGNGSPGDRPGLSEDGGWCFHPTKTAFQGVVIDQYPFVDHEDLAMPADLASLCFPLGARLICAPVVETPLPTFFTSVMVDAYGRVVYVHVLTFYDPIRSEQATSLDLARMQKGKEGGTLFQPKCLVLLSRWNFPDFRKFLTALYRISLSAQAVPLERIICNFVTEVPLPPQGLTVVQYQIAGQELYFRRPPPNRRIDPEGLRFREVFECLSVQNIELLFRCILTEKSILMHSSQVSLLSQTAEVLISLIYPFRWQGQYIPVLPGNPRALVLLDMLGFYIIGVPTDRWHSVRQIGVPSGVVQVDIDCNRVIMDSDVVVPPLPRRVHDKLMRALMTHGDAFGLRRKDWYMTVLPTRDMAILNAPLPCDDTDRGAVKWELDWYQVREAFLRVFTSLLRDYRTHCIAPTPRNPNPREHFNCEAFVSEHYITDAAPLLEQLVRTQAFAEFIDERTETASRSIGVGPAARRSQGAALLLDAQSPDILFFDESISRKRDRSIRRRISSTRNVTSFLDSTADDHKRTVLAEGPDTSDLPGDRFYEYTPFPLLDARLFNPPRRVRSLIDSETESYALAFAASDVMDREPLRQSVAQSLMVSQSPLSSSSRRDMDQVSDSGWSLFRRAHSTANLPSPGEDPAAPEWSRAYEVRVFECWFSVQLAYLFCLSEWLQHGWDPLVPAGDSSSQPPPNQRRSLQSTSKSRKPSVQRSLEKKRSDSHQMFRYALPPVEELRAKWAPGGGDGSDSSRRATPRSGLGSGPSFGSLRSPRHGPKKGMSGWDHARAGAGAGTGGSGPLALGTVEEDDSEDAHSTRLRWAPLEETLSRTLAVLRRAEAEKIPVASRVVRPLLETCLKTGMLEIAVETVEWADRWGVAPGQHLLNAIMRFAALQSSGPSVSRQAAGFQLPPSAIPSTTSWTEVSQERLQRLHQLIQRMTLGGASDRARPRHAPEASSAAGEKGERGERGERGSHAPKHTAQSKAMTTFPFLSGKLGLGRLGSPAPLRNAPTARKPSASTDDDSDSDLEAEAEGGKQDAAGKDASARNSGTSAPKQIPLPSSGNNETSLATASPSATGLRRDYRAVTTPSTSSSSKSPPKKSVWRFFGFGSKDKDQTKEQTDSSNSSASPTKSSAGTAPPGSEQSVRSSGPAPARGEPAPTTTTTTASASLPGSDAPPGARRESHGSSEPNLLPVEVGATGSLDPVVTQPSTHLYRLSHPQQGWKFLSLTFPGLQVDTNSAVCHVCESRLTAEQVRAGWRPDPNDYTSLCPYCEEQRQKRVAATSRKRSNSDDDAPVRLVPRFSVVASGERPDGAALAFEEGCIEPDGELEDTFASTVIEEEVHGTRGNSKRLLLRSQSAHFDIHPSSLGGREKVSKRDRHTADLDSKTDATLVEEMKEARQGEAAAGDATVGQRAAAREEDETSSDAQEGESSSSTSALLGAATPPVNDNNNEMDGESSFNVKPRASVTGTGEAGSESSKKRPVAAPVDTSAVVVRLGAKGRPLAPVLRGRGRRRSGTMTPPGASGSGMLEVRRRWEGLHVMPWRGDTGNNSPIWVEFLSPWVLGKELRSFFSRAGQSGGGSSAGVIRRLDSYTDRPGPVQACQAFMNMRNSSRALYWGLTTLFADLDLPLDAMVAAAGMRPVGFAVPEHSFNSHGRLFQSGSTVESTRSDRTFSSTGIEGPDRLAHVSSVGSDSLWECLPEPSAVPFVTSPTLIRLLRRQQPTHSALSHSRRGAKAPPVTKGGGGEHHSTKQDRVGKETQPESAPDTAAPVGDVADVGEIASPIAARPEGDETTERQ